MTSGLYSSPVPVAITEAAARFSLAGRTVIVTGASSGLGRSLAEGLAQAGCNLVLVARRQALLDDTATRVRRHGAEAIVVCADVARDGAAGAIVEQSIDRFRALHGLVNNAGTAGAVPSLQETEQQFRSVFEVNLLGSYWMAKAAAGAMGPGAAIVNIGSVLASRSIGLPQAAYTSSKAALQALTSELAQQWTGRLGIRVNALVPGFFPSDMTAEIPPSRRAEIDERIPAGRLGEPHELIGPVTFLLSEASSYVSGACLAVDGGFLTR
jgi:NAD(P)-dependent dehydrogenase (short-subunit alcohol dehydrogenase family)